MIAGQTIFFCFRVSRYLFADQLLQKVSLAEALTGKIQDPQIKYLNDSSDTNDISSWKWTTLCNAMRSAAEEVLWFQKKEKSWFDEHQEEIDQLTVQKWEARLAWLSRTYATPTPSWKEKDQESTKNCQRRLCAIQNSCKDSRNPPILRTNRICIASMRSWIKYLVTVALRTQMVTPSLRILSQSWIAWKTTSTERPRRKTSCETHPTPYPALDFTPTPSTFYELKNHSASWNPDVTMRPWNVSAMVAWNWKHG